MKYTAMNKVTNSPSGTEAQIPTTPNNGANIVTNKILSTHPRRRQRINESTGFTIY